MREKQEAIVAIHQEDVAHLLRLRLAAHRDLEVKTTSSYLKW